MYKILPQTLTDINEFHRSRGFDNESRSRYYGLRVGDTVELTPLPNIVKRCDVVGYGICDNNSVYVQDQHGDIYQCVAEWCKIVEKVEDKAPTP